MSYTHCFKEKVLILARMIHDMMHIEVRFYQLNVIYPLIINAEAVKIANLHTFEDDLK